MTRIILSGCLGRMGRAVEAAVLEQAELCIVAGIDPSGGKASYPVFAAPDAIPADLEADVIVDFSHHTALPALLDFAVSRALPVVVATTGHDDTELAAMRSAATKVAIFFSRNMSLGINLLIELCRRAAVTLGDGFDVEIIERHHNRKLDAPSGTALMLADAIAEERSESEYIYDRHAVRRPRAPKEIGIHAVRGGTIVGEHEVMFAGKDEVISLTHSAASREVFATGALRAALWLPGKAPGMYSMQDLVKEM
ncbi:MAG: 4-hydroxy-tetrahydrodipicolinate reductase [Clostridia bacterium]|nr:4-hydroxy-tetrahydrodipicolinate reductase [Clostridia bacterium]